MSRGRKSKKDNLLTALKQAILQQAIQGKLTADWRAENPDIEPASELLKRIKAEKQKLIDEKKIRKEKTLPGIRAEEIPFDLPTGWVWCRLGEAILYSDSGKSPNCEKRPVSNNEWGVLTTTSIQNGFFDETINKVLPTNFKVNTSQIVKENDILITRAGPLNRTGITCKVIFISKHLILSDKTIRLKHPENLILPDYIVTTLNSNEMRNQMISKMTGMADSQVNISQGNIKITIIPLPPLPEQTAIVQKVEALMQKCDALEKGESIQHYPAIDEPADQLLNRYAVCRQLLAELPQQQTQVKQLKQAILQEAIQGKLTADWRAENPDTEPASELLKRIKAEKQKLIDEKKIRKEKPLPVISAEEIPFDLPDGWVWCRLGEIGFTQTGTTPAKNDNSNYGDFIPFLQPSNITENGLNFDCIGLSEDGLSKGRLIKKHSNFMVCIGGSSGKTCFSEVDVSCNQQINTITAYHDIDYKYLDIVLKSPQFQTSVWSTIKQGSTPILNKGKWASIPVPICSNLEQTAIVQKVEALMQTCTDLETQIKQSETHATQLMQAVIKEAFETENTRATP